MAYVKYQKSGKIPLDLFPTVRYPYIVLEITQPQRLEPRQHHHPDKKIPQQEAKVIKNVQKSKKSLLCPAEPQNKVAYWT